MIIAISSSFMEIRGSPYSCAWAMPVIRLVTGAKRRKANPLLPCQLPTRCGHERRSLFISCYNQFNSGSPQWIRAGQGFLRLEVRKYIQSLLLQAGQQKGSEAFMKADSQV